MNRRDIILDFTSLLDVTLIIIFFFVIFSHLDNVEMQKEVDDKVSEMEEAIENAQEQESVAKDLAEQLKEDLAILQGSDDRRAEDLDAIITYNKSGNIKLILTKKADVWILRVNCKEKMIAELDITEGMEEELVKAITTAGCKEEDTVFCDFVFDGSLPGTASAYRRITGALDEVRKTYKHLYYSETDLSVGEE